MLHMLIKRFNILKKKFLVKFSLGLVYHWVGLDLPNFEVHYKCF